MNALPTPESASPYEPGSGAMPTEESARLRDDIRARWLVRVRWGGVAAQATIVALALTLAGAVLPLVTLAGAWALMAVTNVWLWWRLRSARHVSVNARGLLLVLDMVITTVMLYLSGGPSNPFTVFYLVLITVAAVTLGSRWTWLLAALAISSYAGLFLAYVPLPAELHDHDGSNFSKHLRVMWLALTLAGVLTTYFVTRLSRTIEQRDREIELVRERAARHERVAALTTLAAGAAHELGTPLATAMVAVGELERAMSRISGAEFAGIAADVHLIRSELDRCRQILDGMAGQAGETIGERPAAVSAHDLIAEAVSGLQPNESQRVDVECESPSPLLIAPRQALRAAVVNLVRNALQACESPSRVSVRVTTQAQALRVSVCDSGTGMSPEVLARAGDPYFSTRPPGQGRGLGLFLARSLAERLGGRLLLDSVAGRGTTASLELPLSAQTGASR